MKSLFTGLFVLLSLTNAALASSIVCTNENFPKGIGSQIEVHFNTLMEPTHLTISLNNKPAPSLSIKSMAHYRGMATTTNENGTPVNYFQWYASSHIMETEAAINDLASRMVVYDFAKKLNYNSTVSLGMIKWQSGSKIETHEVFHCK